MIPLTLLVAGCSSAGLTKMKDGAMELVGIKSSNDKETAREVTVQTHAGTGLNADDKGRALAVTMKFYRLKDATAFTQASYEALSSYEKERTALGGDLVDVKEATLLPGQEFQRSLTMDQDAKYIGVVVLFRRPFPDRWRFVFSGKEAGNQKGIVLGVHNCAMTVSKGTPYQTQVVNPSSLGGVVCH